MDKRKRINQKSSIHSTQHSRESIRHVLALSKVELFGTKDSSRSMQSIQSINGLINSKLQSQPSSS